MVVACDHGQNGRYQAVRRQVWYVFSSITGLFLIFIFAVGEKCFSSLFENFNFSGAYAGIYYVYFLSCADVGCLKLLVSKILGLGVVVGASVVRVPQILAVVRSRKATGLTASLFGLELISYTFTLAYSVASAFPFSTYGETLFMAIQSMSFVSSLPPHWSHLRALYRSHSVVLDL